MGMGRAGTGSDALEEKFFPVVLNDDLPDLVQEIHRVLKPNRHAYIMCDWETLKRLHHAAIEDGVFKPIGYGGRFESCKPLIWDKVAMGMGYTYRCQYEFILMLWKGKKRRLNDLSIPDVLSYKRVPPSQSIVPTQKPLRLFETLVRQSTQPGEVVYDPFMGSGTTALACVLNDRKYIGCDTDSEHVRLAEERVRREQEAHRAKGRSTGGLNQKTNY